MAESAKELKSEGIGDSYLLPYTPYGYAASSISRRRWL